MSLVNAFFCFIQEKQIFVSDQERYLKNLAASTKDMASLQIPHDSVMMLAVVDKEKNLFLDGLGWDLCCYVPCHRRAHFWVLHAHNKERRKLSFRTKKKLSLELLIPF